VSAGTLATKGVRSPYPGIRPFRRDESPLFFGRDEQVKALLFRLHRNRFLAVVGTSGSGKSSLVLAGLIPELEAGGLGKAGSDWHIAHFRPGNAPLLNLAREIIRAGILGDDWPDDDVSLGSLLARLNVGPRALVELLHSVQIPRLTNLLVVADQFEELFRFYNDQTANEALKFVNLLVATAADRSVPAYVVLTMRSEYLGECALFPGLPELLNDAQFLCPRLNREQMCDAIELPAKLFDGEVEAKLSSQLLNDVGNNSDQLPLIQHCLAKMWNRLARSSSPPRLTVSEYERERVDLHGAQSAEPGVFAALSNHADQVLWSLPDAETREVAERVFRALATRGPSGQMVRRSLSIRQLALESVRASNREESVPTGAQAAEAEHRVIRIADAFRADGHNFLTPPVHDVPKLTSDSMIDICHESLLRQWTTLNQWVEQESRSAATFIRLRDAALRWPDQEPLLRDPALGVALDWKKEQQPTPPWAERYGGDLRRTLQYLDESEEERAKEFERMEATRWAELKLVAARAAEQTANARRFKIAAIALTCLSVAAVAAAALAFVEWYRSVSLYNSVNALQSERGRLEIAKHSLETEKGRLEIEKGRLETAIGNLDAQKRDAEARTSKANADLKSLGEREKTLRLRNEALAAVGAAYGSVTLSSNGEVAVDFLESSASPDAALSTLDRVGRVTSLNLSRTRVSDTGLKSITRLPDLKSLDLSFTDITDAGIALIPERNQLTQLLINDTMLTEKGLSHVEQLVNLKALDLSHNQVNETAVDSLRAKLGGCSITFYRIHYWMRSRRTRVIGTRRCGRLEGTNS
jgi:hypothetical protein